MLIFLSINTLATAANALDGEPDSIDADHWASSRTKWAHPLGSDAGHFTVMDRSPAGISMIVIASDSRLGEAFKGTNAGSAG